MHKSTKLLLGWLLIIFYLFLNGCTTTVCHNDGPPPFDVDVSQIPDAVPECVPLSRCGNQHSYCVFGKRYSVMKSSNHYEAKGIASWYGTKFHSRHTSSGERYNMLGMTAAHKTLPLPTFVEVTNLRNGKKVLVKVNDRGPFESNRIIDLSYVAAKKLGMLARGTAYVHIKAIDPKIYWAERNKQREFVMHEPVMVAHNQRLTHYSNPTKFADNKPNSSLKKSLAPVILQVASFHNKSNAEKLQARLAASFNTLVSIENGSHQSKKIYRVEIGPIEDIAAADQISKRLKLMGLQSKELR